MNAQTVGWLVFLALTKSFSCTKPDYFTLEDSQLTAKEGSCIEIKCRVTGDVKDVGAYWFWIKNPSWNGNDLTGIVVYSTNNTTRPVSRDFADRVKYIGSPSSSWNNFGRPSSELCSILICNLTKNDTGDYAFRFKGTITWITEPPVILTVTENPCPITFELQPPVVKEADEISLTCTTLSKCTSNLQIEGLTQLLPTQLLGPHQTDINQKTSPLQVRFTADWQDDGKEFSCQTQDNKDKYLIRNVSVTVEYAPKSILDEISPKNIVEGQSVTLTCSAKGRPEPSLTWFRNETEAVVGAGPVWKIPSIVESQNGQYHCEAKNKHGTITSTKPVLINVTYTPEVNVMSSASVVQQGDKMTLTCNVKRSNPMPYTYDWFRNGKNIGTKQTPYVVERIKPEDSGLYTCRATNTVGTGISNHLQIEVIYGPRKTNISISKDYKKVDALARVGKPFTFTCNTDANPDPNTYSWYRYNDKQIDSSQWKSKTTKQNKLLLDSVERADEACYRCNATNTINTGEDSERLCIKVLYAPTEPKLSMDAEVREDQEITIICTVESFPVSGLTLTRGSNPQSSEWNFPQPDKHWPPNTLTFKFNATSTHAGFYTCTATNSEGSKKSQQRKLVVKYRPKQVTVQAEPALVVKENQSLTLHCRAQSHPPVTAVTWMKVTDGKSKIIQKTQTFILKSVSPSDSGRYSCAAINEIGTGNSQQAEVKVKYAPKHTKITRSAEQQQPDGTSFVTLSCSSHSYPLVTQYTWYKITAEGRDKEVYDRQNYTVYSDQPGRYYCIAKNEINQRSSDPISVFDRSLMKALYIFLFLIILLIILIVFVYRHKRQQSTQQGTTNTQPCFGFLGGWNSSRRRNQMNNSGMTEPFRSRDDLLPDQPRQPKAQRYQPRPDSTPASNINTVYSTVNLPPAKQGSSAQKPIGQQGGGTQDDSLNYASLHFGNKQKNKHAKGEDDVYAMVSKQKLPKKNEERLEDYENINTADAAKSPNPWNYDTDTSEDETEINYSQVNFKAKPGCQRVNRDSSTSDEEETQYSEVKI